MSLTPAKVPPLPLSPNHQYSIQKSKALDKKVQSFIKDNFQNPSESNTSQMEASSFSLSDTKAFFESQIGLLMKMLDQSNKLYQNKETENYQLNKKLNEYQKKIHKLEQDSAKETINKSKNSNLRIEEKDEKKTRKKTQNDNFDFFKATQSVISEFNLRQSRAKQAEGFIKIKQDQYWRMYKDNLDYNEMKKTKLSLQQRLRQKTSQYESLVEQKIQMVKKVQNLTTDFNNLDLQRHKISTEHNALKTRYQSLEKQYRQLQNKHGKTVAEYEIKIDNLRDLLRGIKDKSSPKRFSEKYEEGYYSINKPLNRNQSQSSFGSSNASCKQLVLSYAEINLKEENQYLRTQLIKALDEKGSIQIKLNKYKKIVDKYQNQKREENTKKQSFAKDQNNQNLSNLNDKKFEESSGLQSFKKNRNTSILIVQNTEKKEKAFLKQQKLTKLIKQIEFIFAGANLKAIDQLIHKKQSLCELFECLLNLLKLYSAKRQQIELQLSKTKKQNQQLKRGKEQIQQKSKNDIKQLKSFLKEMTENESQAKSSDSTDKAFKNIQLVKPQFIQQNSQLKTKQKIFQQKSIQYQQKIKEQQLQIVSLKSRITSLEEMTSSFYRLTNESQLNSQLNAQSLKGNQIVHLSSAELHKNLEYHDSPILELSSFELFKQKLTQFYQHTLQQLDEWSNSALKNGISPPKKLLQLTNEQQKTQHYQIPQIIQRNILRVSQEFKSIKNSSFDEQSTRKNQDIDNSFFKNQKMSKSFIREEKNITPGQETLQEIINKRLFDFQQFSSNWIQQVIAKDDDNQQLKQSSDKIQDQTIKQEAKQPASTKHMNSAKTDRSAVQKRNNFEMEMSDIDARSQSISSSELWRERQVFIRQEISYYVHQNDPISAMIGSTNSRKSYQSFKI